MDVEHAALAFRLASERGLRFRFEAAGRSMWPLLRPGDVALFEPLGRPARPGDVLLYRAGDRLIAHRVIGRTPDGRLRLHGDFTLGEDEPVEPACVLGRLVRVEKRARSGRPAADGVAARLLASALPALQRHLPGPLARLRRAVVRGVELYDLTWTARPVRQLRRLRCHPVTVSVATSADAIDKERYDRLRGRSPGEYAALTASPADSPAFALLARLEPPNRGRRGPIVGVTHLLEPAWTREVGLEGDVWLHDTHILRRFRGLGIGDALTRAALGELSRRGAQRVRVAVAMSNLRSRRLHEQLGFRRFGEVGGHVLFERQLA
jgi:ribosomal protein S18 acetylase RimI-like enzyme